MLVRTTLTLAALALAGPASAQSYSPPGMTWGPSRPGSSPPAVTEPPPPLADGRSSRGVELDGGVYLGRFAGEREGAGGLEVVVARASGAFTVGGRAFVMGSSRGGPGLGVIAGPRVRLGQSVGLDLRVDAGVLRHAGGYTPRALASFGARAMLAFGGRPGTTFAVGPILQVAQKSETGGGTILGLCVAVGHAWGGAEQGTR